MRPDALKNMCFAEFVACYKYSSKQQTVQDDDVCDMRDEQEAKEETHIEDNNLKSFPLQKGMGNMVPRKTVAIVRSHQWSRQKAPEQYYHAMLLLYLPWKHEVEDLRCKTYEECYNSKIETIRENQRRFEKHVEEVTEAIQDLEEFGPSEESWNTLAPQTEQSRTEENEEGAELEKSVLNMYDTRKVSNSSRDLGLPFHEYEFLTENMSSRDWYDLIMSLNSKQSEVHQFIVEWCTKMTLSHLQPKPNPFHIFLTGGAGVGKSHLVRTIVQTITRLLSCNNQTGENHVLVCAPTGAAAYNISGHTLHSAFLLPLHVRKSDDYIALSGEKLSALKEAIGSVKVLIIDEISMVGTDMLLLVHRRLCDVMASEEPFGGVSILAVGDLLQLPPVAQKPVFAPPSDELAALYGSLWKNHFKMVELTEIQRQKNDLQFAELLNRLRIGGHTREDIDTLKTRKIEEDSEAYPHEVTHIFPKNEGVDRHNKKMLKNLDVTKITVNAIDCRKDVQTGQVDTTELDGTAGGLFKTLVLGVGARVMLIKNLDVQDGLVNSATGVIVGFRPSITPDTDLSTYKPNFVLVKFDDDRVGRKHRSNSNDGSTAIPMIETQVTLGRHSKITKKRTQFPLTLAWGITIHKEQGKTEDQLVLHCKGTFQAGMFYTAVSRTKNLSGLFIVEDFTSNIVKVNQPALQELNRMKINSVFSLPLPPSFLCQPETHFKLHLHNVNSFIPHSQSIFKEDHISHSHVTCLSETWLKSSDPTPNFDGYNIVRHDSTSSDKHRNGGLMTIIHEDFLILRMYRNPNLQLEHQLIILSPRLDTSLRLCIISVYKNPRFGLQEFLQQLETVLQAVPLGIPVIVCGDFNINILRQQPSTSKLSSLLSYYGFPEQCVKASTHRKGGLIDHIYFNFPADSMVNDSVPKYYSDHMLLSVAVPYKELFRINV